MNRKTPQANPHQGFSHIKIGLLILALMAASMGYFIPRKEPTVNTPTDNTPDLDFDFPEDLIYSKCGANGNLEECLTQITQHIANDIIPLNQLPSAFFKENRERACVEVMASPQTDPNKPGGVNAVRKMNELRDKVEEVYYINRNKLAARMGKHGLKEDSESHQFLLYLFHIVENAYIPNCAGMSTQVIGRLLAQNITRAQDTTVSLEKRISSCAGEHTFVRAENARNDLTSDPWMTRDRVCNMKTTQNKACKIYNSKFWQRVDSDSYSLKWPNLSQEKPKARKFFRHQTMKMLKKLSAYKRQAESYSEELERERLAQTRQRFANG